MSKKTSDRRRAPESDGETRDTRGDARAQRPAGENPEDGRAPGREGLDDEDLSALLDGELAPEREEALRRRLVDEPALAARWAQLGEVTGQLRHLAHPAEASQAESAVEQARIERIHGALRVRLAAVEADEEEARPADADPRPRARVISLRPSLRWLAPAAAAVAASLALYWTAGNFSGSLPGSESDGAAPPGNALPAPGLIVEAAPAPVPVPEPAPAQTELARAPAPQAAPGIATETAADEEAAEAEWAAIELAEIDDDELAIAFEFDVLANFEVIENLELLELLDELDRAERI
jgi:hypothetical protein